MKRLSLKPDEHMAWIYDYRHPDYNSPMAKSLRERRARALANCPEWMIREAQINDSEAENAPKVGNHAHRVPENAGIYAMNRAESGE